MKTGARLFLTLSIMAFSIIAMIGNSALSEVVPNSICDNQRAIVIATEGSKFEPFKSFTPVFKKVNALNLEVGKIPTGFEIDLLNTVFNQMPCYSVSFIFNYDSAGEAAFEGTVPNEILKKSRGPIDFGALFPGLTQKRKSANGLETDQYLWDMTIATTGITQERRDKYKIEFSDTYFKPRKHFFGRATLTQFPQDLAGKRIGVKAKTLFAKYALFINKHLAELNLTPMILTEFDDVTLPAFDKIFAALKQNQIDLTLADDELFITAKQNDTGLTPFQLTGPDLIQAFGHEQFGEGVGVAFRQSDTVLTLDFNRALKAVILNCGTGGYKSIYEKYFKAASSLISHCK